MADSKRSGSAGSPLPMTEACVVITTCGSEETALTIASGLVDQGLAACVNILPTIKSYYYYQGGTHLDEEVMIIIKTTRELFDQVSQLITDLHTYEVPEILMFPVGGSSEPFMDWLKQSVTRMD